MADIFDENESENRDDESFAEMFEAYGSEITQDIRQGDRIDGKIIAIGESSVYIDTGSKSDGVVDKMELLDENGGFPYSVGDTVGLYVVSLSESEIILSKAISGAGMASMLEEASYNRTPVEGKVSGTIKGGFSVDIMGKRAFCPVSQIDVKYVETPEDYVGGVYNFIITRFAEGGRNIVVSRRDLLNEELKEKRRQFFEEVSEGDTLPGHVTKLMPYGAFIELIPGVEGMAHISELSWSRVEKAEEAVSPGEAVNVKILKIEAKEGSDIPKISLSLKQTEADPWAFAGDNIHTGDQLTGKVMRLAPFGAFVEIAPGMEGLVHLSEMSYTKRVLKADDVVSKGETVQVVVKEIDTAKKRISLSIRDAHGDPWAGAAEKYKPGTFVEGTVEKREKFGIFITIEAGVTGLLPGSGISRSSNPAEFDKLKPGDAVKVMVEAVDEEKRRLTLVPQDLKDGDSWKKFAKPEKETMGTMGELLMKAMKKNK